MYVTGTEINLENRLHELCVTSGDLTNFQTESGDYSPDAITLGKWEKEFDKKYLQIYGESP